MKNLCIPGSAGREIVLDVFLADSPSSPLLIFSHGFKGFKDWGSFNEVAARFQEAGISFLKFNFSHNGTSKEDLENFCDLEAFGNNNFSKEMNDLGTVIDWAFQELKEKVDLDRIYLMGHSRGGGLSILKAREDNRIQAVISWASVCDFEKRLPQEKIHIWKERGVVYAFNGRTKQQMPMYYQFREDFYSNKERLDIPSATKQLNCPLLIVHGTADTTVVLEEAHSLYAWAKQAKLVEIEEADHVFDAKHPMDQQEKMSDALNIAIEESIQFLKNE
jgi:dienelactone hydrolase